MNGGLRAQLRFYPETHLSDSGHVVIHRRNNEIRDFKVDLCPFQGLEGFEHRSQFTAAHVTIEVFREALEIDVGGIHDLAEISQWLRIDEAVRVTDIEQPCLLCEKSDVQHIFIEDRGLHIGIGNGSSTHFLGLAHHELGRDVVAVYLLRRGLRDLPVLTEFALQVASCGGQGKRSCGRQNVKERFLLNGIEMNRAGVSVDQAVVFSISVFTDPAEPPLSLRHTAMSRAEGALDVSTLEGGEEGREFGLYEAFLRGLGVGDRRAPREMTREKGAETQAT